VEAVVLGAPGAGKSILTVRAARMLALVQGAGTTSSGFASLLSHGIAAADQVRNDLAGSSFQVLDVAPTISFRSALPLVPAAGQPLSPGRLRWFLINCCPSRGPVVFTGTGDAADGGDGGDADRSDEGWLSDDMLVASRLLDVIGRAEQDQNVTCASAVEVESLLVRLNLSADLRKQWLRLLDGIRSTLRLMLIRVRSALSRLPKARDFGLVLFTASRCFGHRSDPGDHGLPVRMPMSVVIGEAAGSV
jgi:hypothetical protein